MKISEIEKRTGLPAKTIRFYESKGLLNVGRLGNTYRDYDNTSVDILLKIKLLRNLDISIQDIKSYLLDESRIQDILRKYQENMNESLTQTEFKCELLDIILKHAQTQSDFDLLTYSEEAEIMASTEFINFAESLKEVTEIPLISIVCNTLIFLGPILSLFIRIATHDYSLLFIDAIFAIISSIALSLLWPAFLKQRNKHVKSNLWLILGMLGACIGYLFVLGGLYQLKLHLLMPRGLILTPPIPGRDLYIISGFFMFLVVSFFWLYKHATFLSWKWAEICYSWLNKMRYLIILFYIFLACLFMAN